MNENEKQNQDIRDMKKDISSKVSWVVFYAFIGLLFVVLGLLINSQVSASAQNREDHKEFNQTKIDVEGIKTDIKWIRSAMEANGIKPIK